MDISQEILAGFNLLPKVKCVIDGNEIDCIFNLFTHRDSKEYGGYEPDDDTLIYVKSSDIINAKSQKGKTLFVKGSNYRIVDVIVGDYLTHFRVISVNKK